MKKENIEQEKTILINENKIFYTLIEKDIKNFYMKLTRNNKIVVSVPIKARKKDIEEFINKNIENFQKKILQNNARTFLNEEQEWFYLFGEKKYFIVQNNYFLYELSKKRINNNSIEKIVLSCYRKELIKYVEHRQRYFEEKMDSSRHDINIFLRKSIWGSNSIQKKKITYSLFLASFSQEIIDYVIIHELAHERIQGHNKDFWELVSIFEPDWRGKRKYLKNKKFTWKH